MTIAENQNPGNKADAEPKKSGFFTSEELDLLDIPEPGTDAKNGQKMSRTQTAIIVLLLTAAASFALGMLAERSIDSAPSVVGQGSTGTVSSTAASNAENPQSGLTLPQGQSVK